MPGYTPPAGNAVNFSFIVPGGGYTPPAGNAVNINFITLNAYTLAPDPGIYTLVGAPLGTPAKRVLQMYNELIVNGYFTLDAHGWSLSGANAALASVGAQGQLTLNPSATGDYAYQAVNVTPGRKYTISAYLVPSTAIMSIGSGVYSVAGTGVTLTYGHLPTLHDQSISGTSSLSIGVGYEIKPDGGAYSSISTTGETLLETWLPSGASASSYDVRATLVSGTLGSGTYNSWLNCATLEEWGLTNSSSGTTLTCVIKIELSHAGAGVAIASANITISATKT